MAQAAGGSPSRHLMHQHASAARERRLLRIHLPWLRATQCCLTPRSRRGPTSKRQARKVGWRIFHHAGLAFCCRSRLSSNVRPHTNRYRWPTQHREQPMPKTMEVPLSRFGHTTAQRPLLGRTGRLDEEHRCSSLGFQLGASRQLAGAFCLLASVSSLSHRPRKVLPSFSSEQGGETVSASAAPAMVRSGGLNKASSCSVMSAIALAPVRPNPSFKPSPNGVPRGPGRRYAVHFRHPGPRVTPLVPA